MRCTLIKKACKKKFFKPQVQTAIRKSSNLGALRKGWEQMYPVY